jgi:hypothetical protein
MARGAEMGARQAKPADQVLADLRKEWKTATPDSRKEIEQVAEKVKIVDLIMTGSQRK